jgi:(p)ppGpp synthase/HD superfamily hydrolase
MNYESAKLVATLAHKNQKYGNHPYSYHLQMVVDILKHYNLGPRYIASGWLHDILEYTEVTFAELSESFGEEVASIVEACTGRGSNRIDRNADIRLKLEVFCPDAKKVKLADRMANIHNCIIEGNVGLRQMYIREDIQFSQTVAIGVPIEMWDDYRNLVSTLQPLSYL